MSKTPVTQSETQAMTPFTVTSEDQGCSGHMDTIPAGQVAFKDADGWVWCAGAAAQVVAEAARRDSVRETLTARYHGAIDVTDEMIDAVVDALDEDARAAEQAANSSLLLAAAAGEPSRSDSDEA